MILSSNSYIRPSTKHGCMVRPQHLTRFTAIKESSKGTSYNWDTSRATHKYVIMNIGPL